ncbi:MAG: hypothetical protein ACREOH_23645 [Candidatus Entotheonellia bacterium]
MLDHLSKFIALVSLIIGVYAALKALPHDEEIKKLNEETVRLDNEVKRTESELKSLQASRELTFKLYGAVKEVLERKDKETREEEAVRVLVESLGEDPFRGKLLQALAMGAKSQDVKEKAEKTATYYQEEATKDSPATSAGAVTKRSASAGFGNWNIDFFYCESSKEQNAPRATNAMTLRESGSIGRWRVRMLPDEINARPGYGVHDHLIRYNADEKEVTERLQKALKQKLQIDINAMQIGSPTPNYLSVFFCG